MKLSLIFSTFAPLLLSALFVSGKTPASNTNHNYVVIGAFAYEKNAVHFTEAAKKNQFDARFEINPGRNLFYVYVLQTEDRKLAFEQAQNLRQKTSFSDTWVYTGLLGQGSALSKGSDVNPSTGEKIEQITIEDKPTSSAVIQSSLTSQDTQSTTQQTPKNESDVPSATVSSVSSANSTDNKDGRMFFFKIVKAANQKEIAGDVDVIDQEKQKKTASYTGNQDVFIRTVNESGNVLLKCEVFGYRKLEHPINFNEPQPELATVENDKVIVPFELVRLKKGDIAVMYNVFFYKDAAIMRPESRSEVTSLLDMMKENPKLKVKIHGHTNGGAAGKIIEAGDSRNYFSLSGTKEGHGSAKRLSEERAQVIRDFLASEGIDPSRMEVKAWGGKKPIYEKDHAQAQTNVRVEIEILEDGNN